MNENFLRGKGLTISPSHVDNLFRLNPKYKTESKDYVFIKKFLNKKQFAPILLKEAFFLIKPKGYLIIDYVINKEINFTNIESLLWWLFKGNYSIVKHVVNRQKGNIVIQKKEAVISPLDSIDKWTFGIITNGERDDWMEMIIKSIKEQNIPNYEIIVCGKYKNRNEKNYTYINFNERSDKGWIGKKKNLICEIAKYENLCIIHDRIVFNKGWYKGMKKYGNAFELLGCMQTEKNGLKAGDWLTFGGPINSLYKIARLNYNDWNYYIYLGGFLTIIKKSIWGKILWDETRYWNQKEDVDISFRARDMGYIIRFNPYSSCQALGWRHGNIPLKYNITEGLLPKDMLGRRIIRFFARVFYKIPVLNNFILWNFSWFSKTFIYRFLKYH